MITKALILAGGLGTRLRPLTDKTPKPLLPIKGKPILQHALEHLKRQGITDIILSVGFEGEKIRSYFQDGKELGIAITYSPETEPLGTGGAIKKALAGITEPVLVIWGDNLMDINYKELHQAYQQHQTPVTMTLTPREDVENFGVAELQGNKQRGNKIVRFVEKPAREKAPSNLINAGAIILEPASLKILPEGKSSIEHDLYEKLKPGEITAYIHTGQWFPTDTLEKHSLADAYFKPLVALNPNIFKAYDIRGEWGVDWDDDTAYNIGVAIAKQFQPSTIVIGRDMRNSSEKIAREISIALQQHNITVKDLGLCGTELAYFASYALPEVDLSLMITASHNPEKDNGIKICLKGGKSIGLGSGLEKIRALVVANSSIRESNSASTRGTIENIELWDQYREKLLTSAALTPAAFLGLKLVVDAGNGVGGYLFDKLFSTFPFQVRRLCWQPDGFFPNHPADPFDENNVSDLKKAVKEEQADLGLAYDGDADRVFFVDETGRYLPGYYLAALLTEYFLQQSLAPSAEKIVHDPRYYWATHEVIRKYGATPVKSKVGHTLIKALLRQHNSLLSLECSGHTFYRETNFTESSMLTTLLVLKLILEQGPLSKLVDRFFLHYPISGEHNFIVTNPQDVFIRLKEEYAKGEIDELDGLEIIYPEWRCSVRNSNTQPLLRLNIEAKTKELVEQKLQEITVLLREVGGNITE